MDEEEREQYEHELREHLVKGIDTFLTATPDYEEMAKNDI
jgi:hypothetical protein